MVRARLRHYKGSMRKVRLVLERRRALLLFEVRGLDTRGFRASFQGSDIFAPTRG